MSKIFANINPASKYQSQSQDKPFEITLMPDEGGYHWKGGVGGQYRTADLIFFSKHNGEFYQFDLCKLGSIDQLKNAKNEVLSGEGKGWHSSYWELVIEVTQIMNDAAKNEYAVQMAKEQKEREEEY